MFLRQSYCPRGPRKNQKTVIFRALSCTQVESQDEAGVIARWILPFCGVRPLIRRLLMRRIDITIAQEGFGIAYDVKFG